MPRPIHRTARPTSRARRLARYLTTWALLVLPAAGLDHFSVRESVLPSLAQPTDVLVRDHGELWITEPDARRIRIVDPEGGGSPAFVGGPDSELELVRPVGICQLDATHIALSDQGSDRIHVLDAEGRSLGSMGSRGTARGELRAPSGVVADGTTLYVADTGNRRISRFLHDGTPLDPWGQDLGWVRPVDVALDRRGHLFVLDTDSATIHKLDEDGAPILSFGGFGRHPGGLRIPGGLHFQGGRLYVADRGNHRIQEFDTSGNLLGIWGRPSLQAGQDDGGLFAPSALDLSADGSRIWVCEPWEGRLQSFVRGDDGAEHDHVGHSGEERGALLGEFLAGDAHAELLLVHDRERDEVLVYDTRHDAPIRIATLGGHGTGLGEFRAPSGGAIDSQRDLVWIADAGNTRLQAFRLRRDPENPLAYEPLGPMVVKSIDLGFLRRGAGAKELPHTVRPGAMSCDAEGRLRVVDSNNGVVLVLAPDHRLEGILRMPGGAPMSPSSIALDEEMVRTWVLDDLGRRVLAFGPGGHLEQVLEVSAQVPEPISMTLGQQGALLLLGRKGELVHWKPSDRTGSRGDRIPMDTLGIGGPPGPQSLRRPTAIVGHPRGLLYVLDPTLRQGQLLDARGNFRLAF